MTTIDDDSPIPPPVDLKVCPDCRSATVHVPEAFHRPLMLTDRDQVVNWPNLTPLTQHQHLTKAQRAFYKTPKQTPKVECSLRHHHRRGQIVETMCGITILLGWKCAANALSDYDKTTALRDAAESYFRKLAIVRRVPGELLDKLKVLVPYLVKADQFRSAKWETSFGLEMRRRATSGQPRDTEVTFQTEELAAIKATDLGDMRVRRTERTVKIEGLPFWNAHLDVRGATAALETANDLISDVAKLDEQDHQALGELHRRTKTLETATAKIEPIYDLCRQFLGSENLRVAGAALGRAA
jgi:hypothetical protein